MNSSSVHLIATDPPFNKGRDFHATPDSLASGASFQDRWSWREDVEDEWVDQIRDDFPKVMNVIEGSRSSYGDDMGAFLCFMAVRLVEMKRVLREDGSIYLHCDDTAVHYLKELMDAIFGRKNFKNEIIWRRVLGGKSDAGQYGRSSDRILYYTKSDHFYFDPPRLKTANSRTNEAWFPLKDSKGTYQRRPLTAHGTTGGDSGQPWRDINPTGHWVVPNLLSNRYESETGEKLTGKVRERLEILANAGYIEFSKNKKPYWRKYLHEANLPRVQDIWVDDEVKPIQRTSKEKTGYPTQKPIALYERIIKASSSKGDIVLDPFAGCATTCIVAEKNERQWVGIDIWDKVQNVVLDRLEKEGLKAPKHTKRKTALEQGFLFAEDLHFTSDLPERTDDGEEAIPFLTTKIKVPEPKDEFPTHAAKRKHLLEQNGPVCQGCYRKFDDDRYLELDHNQPRSDGGWNHIANRILLCGPCNRLKSNTYTLSGLQKLNKKLGYMAK